MAGAGRRFDVVIVGAGPAGCAAALQLASIGSVLLIDRQQEIRPRIGESLHPAGRQLLSQLGLLQSMADEDHAPCFANRSIWGSARPVEQDFLRHPDGAGWHLDRARFDRWLRDNAVARGVTLLAGVRTERIAPQADGWRIDLSGAADCDVVSAGIVVEASGRRSMVARALGVRRTHQPHDRLVCGWVHLKSSGDAGAGITIVEATADGWWYTAPLPGGGRVLAFHTDRDLPASRIAADRAGLPHHAARTTHEIARVLAADADRIVTADGYTVAHGSFLARPSGDGWLAVGDAALATDPIVARGLLHALDTGIAAAMAVQRSLAGERDAYRQYDAELAALTADYRRSWQACYAQERRFATSAFWQRRHAA